MFYGPVITNPNQISHFHCHTNVIKAFLIQSRLTLDSQAFKYKQVTNCQWALVKY